MAVKAIHNDIDTYIFHFLKTIPLGNISRSTTVPSIRKEDIENIILPFPPSVEQKVIADLLDQLIAQTDKLKLHLETILTTLKQFRQSVLNAAVTGKLVKSIKPNENKKYKLSTFVDIGHAFKSKEFTNNGIPLLRGQNIDPGNLKWIDVKYFPKEKLNFFFTPICKRR